MLTSRQEKPLPARVEQKWGNVFPMPPRAQTPLAENLDRLMEAQGLSPMGLSKAAGLSPKAVSQILRGNSVNARADTVARLAQALGVPAETLTGRPGQPVMLPVPPVRTVTVREYDVRAAAGAGAEPPTLDGDPSMPVVAQWQVPADFLPYRYRGVAPVILRVDGDSMEPEYVSGDPVLVDVAHRRPSPAGIYVVWDGYGLVVKQLELLDEEPRRVKLSSINPRYEAYYRSPEDVRIVGKVIGKWMWK